VIRHFSKPSFRSGSQSKRPPQNGEPAVLDTLFGCSNSPSHSRGLDIREARALPGLLVIETVAEHDHSRAPRAPSRSFFAARRSPRESKGEQRPSIGTVARGCPILGRHRCLAACRRSGFFGHKKGGTASHGPPFFPKRRG
jgi:hypothetical protein